jgi:hypothetical protein
MAKKRRPGRGVIDRPEDGFGQGMSRGAGNSSDICPSRPTDQFIHEGHVPTPFWKNITGDPTIATNHQMAGQFRIQLWEHVRQLVLAG